MNKNGFLYTVLFAFIISFVFVLPLSLANEVTKEKVAENNRVNEYRAILLALGVPFELGNNQDIIEKFSVVSPVEADGQLAYYQAEVGGQKVYALPTSGPGLWGTIHAMLGFNSELDRLTGLTIVSHSETPGLGGRIEEDWFLGQFTGQAIPADGKLVFKQGTGSGDAEPDDNLVDAITGATRTTEGMAVIVEQAAASIRSLVGGN